MGCGKSTIGKILAKDSDSCFLDTDTWIEEKEQITISYDSEKMYALKMYIGQKNTTVEQELLKALESLYGKIVPTDVREFIALRSGIEASTGKRKKKANPPESTERPPTVGDDS